MNATVITEHGSFTTAFALMPAVGNTVWFQFTGQNQSFCYRIYEIRWDFTVKKPPELKIIAGRDLPA